MCSDLAFSFAFADIANGSASRWKLSTAMVLTNPAVSYLATEMLEKGGPFVVLILGSIHLLHAMERIEIPFV